MASNSRYLEATCLCGNAKHSITLQKSDLPTKAYACHCQSCRHANGTLCFTAAFMPKTYSPSPTLLDKLRPYPFSKRITMYFCPTCGTKMATRCLSDAAKPDGDVVWGIPTGSLQQADGVFEVQGHEHVEDTLDGGCADFLPSIQSKTLDRWPGGWEEKEVLPLPWTSPSRPTVEPAPTDKLHAHCICNAINLYISRPSDRSALVKADWPDVLVPHDSSQPAPTNEEAWYLRADRTKFLAGLCSCDSCRLASGMEWVQWAFIPAIDISLDKAGNVPFAYTDPALKELVTYRSSPGPDGARRSFCGKCGAMVFWDGDCRPNLKDVAAGLLAAPEGARAETWLEWRTQRLSYREDALPRAEHLTLAVENGLLEYGRRMGQDV